MCRRIGKVDFRPHVTPAPAATLSVLVVDPDPVGRPALARALLRAKWSVTVVDSPAELAGACDDGQECSVVLVHMAHPHASEIVLEVVARYPHASLVARSRDTSRTQAMLEDMGVVRVEVRSSDAPPEELVEAIRRTLGV